jgi:Ni,Fe-hydrogenase maturation factor
LLVGYDKAVIIDAIQTVEGKAGDVYHLDPRDFD